MAAVHAANIELPEDHKTPSFKSGALPMLNNASFRLDSLK